MPPYRVPNSRQARMTQSCSVSMKSPIFVILFHDMTAQPHMAELHDSALELPPYMQRVTDNGGESRFDARVNTSM